MNNPAKVIAPLMISNSYPNLYPFKNKGAK
jgi:hypothetical protein